MKRLLDLPHAEARRLLATGAPVFVPVNPVEYHGPHLSLHNDALITAGVVRDVHARLAAAHPDWPLLVTRDLEVGVDPVPGPGSRPVPYAEVKRAVVRTCEALADLGARTVVLATFHGAPLHELALEAGCAVLRRRGVAAVAPFHAVVAELVGGGIAAYGAALDCIADADVRRAAVEGLPLDFHAGLMETSISLHYAPDSVDPRYRTLPPCPPFAPVPALLALGRAVAALGGPRAAQELRFAAQAAGWYALRPFPGYTGDPRHASAEIGAWFARLIAERFATLIEDVVAGRPAPPPPFRWLPAVSLGGRFGTPIVPLADVGAEFAN